MFFDHKTKKLTGELGYISPERKRRLEQLVAEGKMTCTRHPSEEEINRYLDTRDVEKVAAEAMRIARERGMLKRKRDRLD